MSPMSHSHLSTQWMKTFDSHRSEIVRLYKFEKWTSEQVKSAMVAKHLGSSYQISMHQWKRLLSHLKIRKNLYKEQAIIIKAYLDAHPSYAGHVIVVDGVLLHSNEIEEYCRRADWLSPIKGRAIQETVFISTPYTFDRLDEPFIFESFRRLLFYTMLHFEKCFQEGEWNVDQRGLYARSPTRRAELSKLSNLHNMVVAAVKQFQTGNDTNGKALIRNAFGHNQEIVQFKHHRQFSDIIAILLLLQRHDFGIEIQESLVTDLRALAEKCLNPEEPRRTVFQSLVDLPLDPSGHLFLAYDSYCRYLWALKTGHDRIKSCYSYNQASFPRADPGGFYDLFHGQRLEEIQLMLRRFDQEIGFYTHETFCVWHMTAHWFRHEGKVEDMEYLLQVLCERITGLEGDSYCSQERQLNLDCTISFYLLGDALEAQEEVVLAMAAFEKAVEIRGRHASSEDWEPGKAMALQKLESVARRLDYEEKANDCMRQLERMHASQKRENQRTHTES